VKRFRNNDLLRVQNEVCNSLNRELVGHCVEVLCEGPSGWGDAADGAAGDGAKGDAESIVAAGRSLVMREAAGAGGAGGVELGATLAAGVRRQGAAATAERLDRQGKPFVTPGLGRHEAGWRQMSGRTQHDQIVVFEGPESVTGRILTVRVREAHGMTIFADLLD